MFVVSVVILTYILIKRRFFCKKESPLRLSFMEPHRAVFTQTVPRWILQVLGVASIDSKTFSELSNRLASTQENS